MREAWNISESEIPEDRKIKSIDIPILDDEERRERYGDEKTQPVELTFEDGGKKIIQCSLTLQPPSYDEEKL